MMRFAVSIYDRKTGSFADPFFTHNVEEVFRQFKLMFRNRPQQLPIWMEFPEDYELRVIGCFENGTGLFSESSPKVVPMSVFLNGGEPVDMSKSVVPSAPSVATYIKKFFKGA